jgi:hypothetical protein
MSQLAYYRLADHLVRCSGKAVIVFDEVQKVIPYTLDGKIVVYINMAWINVSTCSHIVLMEALSSRAQFTYFKNGVSKKIDTSNVSSCDTYYIYIYIYIYI